jgi:hypothetical protein
LVTLNPIRPRNARSLASGITAHTPLLNARELTITMYYANNRAIVRRQLVGKILAALDPQEDQHPARAALNELLEKWKALMEKHQCEPSAFKNRIGESIYFGDGSEGSGGGGGCRDCGDYSGGPIGLPMPCYLTTVAVGAVGLADDCWELRTLRRFRDAVLERSAAGRALVRRYYRFAPRLVAAVSRRADAQRIWLKTWAFGILPAALCARAGMNRAALFLYRRMARALIKMARLTPEAANAPLPTPIRRPPG